MRKSSSKIREEIEKLQEQLRAAETKEAERIGRIAIRAGLGALQVEEDELLEALGDLAKRFRAGASKPAKASAKPAGIDQSNA